MSSSAGSTWCRRFGGGGDADRLGERGRLYFWLALVLADAGRWEDDAEFLFIFGNLPVGCASDGLARDRPVVDLFNDDGPCFVEMGFVERGSTARCDEAAEVEADGPAQHQHQQARRRQTSGV